MQLERLFILITQEYETIAFEDLCMDESKHRATIAFLPYAARWEKDGKGKLPNTPLYHQVLTRLHVGFSK